MNRNLSTWSAERLIENVDMEAAEINAKKICIRMDVDITTMLSVIGALQLACRHPGFVGPSREIVGRLISQFAHELKDYPALVELIRRGGLKEYDVTAAEAKLIHLVRKPSSAAKQERGSDVKSN